MVAHPRHTYAAKVLEAQKGLGFDALACVAGAIVIVQGEREAPPDARWCCSSGRTGLVPLAQLQPVATSSIPARALFEFAAGDSAELTISRGEMVTLTPKLTDATGWCSATSNAGGKKRTGLVPQNYVMPVIAHSDSTTTRPPKGTFTSDSTSQRTHVQGRSNSEQAHPASGRRTLTQGGTDDLGVYNSRASQGVANMPHIHGPIGADERSRNPGELSELTGYTGAVTPPQGFSAAKAMTQIWELGLAIARAPSSADPKHMDEFERRIQVLNAQLKGWALAEDQKAGRAAPQSQRNNANVPFASSPVRRHLAREERVARWSVADMNPEQQSRLTQYDEPSSPEETGRNEHSVAQQQSQQQSSAASLQQSKPKPSGIGRVLSFGRRSTSTGSPSAAPHGGERAPPGGPAKKGGGVLGKVQRSLSFGSSKRRSDASASPAAAFAGRTSAATKVVNMQGREEAIRAVANLHRARSFERQNREAQHRATHITTNAYPVQSAYGMGGNSLSWDRGLPPQRTATYSAPPGPSRHSPAFYRNDPSPAQAYGGYAQTRSGNAGDGGKSGIDEYGYVDHNGPIAHGNVVQVAAGRGSYGSRQQSVAPDAQQAQHRYFPQVHQAQQGYGKAAYEGPSHINGPSGGRAPPYGTAPYANNGHVGRW